MLSFIKSLWKEFLREQSQEHYRQGFEYAMSAYYIYGLRTDELADDISSSPDSFDMGVLKAIQVINRQV